MQTAEHIQTAQDFLEAADREFAAGDELQGSEKMWGAAAHAVMTVARDRGWPHGSHRHLKSAADRIIEDIDDPVLGGDFMAAQQFHANFYHGFMEDDDIERGRPLVRRFVNRVLEYAGA